MYELYKKSIYCIFIIFWLLFVCADSIWSDKEAGWPMRPNTYVMNHITCESQIRSGAPVRMREEDIGNDVLQDYKYFRLDSARMLCQRFSVIVSY